MRGWEDEEEDEEEEGRRRGDGDVESAGSLGCMGWGSPQAQLACSWARCRSVPPTAACVLTLPSLQRAEVERKEECVRVCESL